MAAHMRRPAIEAGLLLNVALAAVCAHAQIKSPAPDVGPDQINQINQIYAQADPYMDKALPELKHAVPALKGLKSAASQSDLQSILDRTGEALQSQVPRIPDLAARESVWQAQFAIPPKGQEPEATPMPMGRGGRRGSQPEFVVTQTMSADQLEEKLHSSLLTGAPWKEFDYMMLFRQTDTGLALEESRTDPKAAQSPEDAELPLRGTGFGYIWLMFLPGNMPQERFRYLGEQKMYGREAYAVAFAQSADRVKNPGEIDFLGAEYALLYQGVAWIDEATFQIVRLRTDLLAPLTGIQLQWLHSDLRFSEVRIPELNLPLWLPRQVELTWRQADELGGEMHVYTKYRLFHATARMLPAAK
jgi:hypothetical protein